MRACYNLAEQHNILATYHIEPERHVRKALADNDALNGLLQHDVGKLIKGAHDPDDLALVAQLHQHLGCSVERKKAKREMGLAPARCASGV